MPEGSEIPFKPPKPSLGEKLKRANLAVQAVPVIAAEILLAKPKEKKAVMDEMKQRAEAPIEGNPVDEMKDNLNAVRTKMARSGSWGQAGEELEGYLAREENKISPPKKGLIEAAKETLAEGADYLISLHDEGRNMAESDEVWEAARVQVAEARHKIAANVWREIRKNPQKSIRDALQDNRKRMEWMLQAWQGYWDADSLEEADRTARSSLERKNEEITTRRKYETFLEREAEELEKEGGWKRDSSYVELLGRMDKERERLREERGKTQEMVAEANAIQSQLGREKEVERGIETITKILSENKTDKELEEEMRKQREASSGAGEEMGEEAEEYLFRRPGNPPEYLIPPIEPEVVKKTEIPEEHHAPAVVHIPHSAGFPIHKPGVNRGAFERANRFVLTLLQKVLPASLLALPFIGLGNEPSKTPSTPGTAGTPTIPGAPSKEQETTTFQNIRNAVGVESSSKITDNMITEAVTDAFAIVSGKGVMNAETKRTYAFEILVKILDAAAYDHRDGVDKTQYGRVKTPPKGWSNRMKMYLIAFGEAINTRPDLDRKGIGLAVATRSGLNPGTDEFAILELLYSHYIDEKLSVAGFDEQERKRIAVFVNSIFKTEPAEAHLQNTRRDMLDQTTNIATQYLVNEGVRKAATAMAVGGVVASQFGPDEGEDIGRGVSRRGFFKLFVPKLLRKRERQEKSQDSDGKEQNLL